MRVGITGHQDLGTPDDVEWVTEQLRTRVNSQTLHAGVTSLAIGADQLYASLLTLYQKPFTALIPCRHYESTFTTPQHLERYRVLLEQADEVVYLPFDEPSSQVFWEAGQRVVESSDYMIAVWNGLPAKGLGGTGDVVRHCLDLGRAVLHINPRTRQVEELIETARPERP